MGKLRPTKEQVLSRSHKKLRPKSSATQTSAWCENWHLTCDGEGTKRQEEAGPWVIKTMVRTSLSLLQFPVASAFTCNHILFQELRLWDCRFKQVLLFLSSLFSTTGCSLPRLRKGLVKRQICCYFIPSFSHSVSPSSNHTANSGLFLQLRGASVPPQALARTICFLFRLSHFNFCRNR